MAVVSVEGFRDTGAAARESLQACTSGALSGALVAPGDEVAVPAGESGFLRGHGTAALDGKVVATVVGVVERVNKLVSVRPLQTRYVAETGDVVVGRVVEVSNKRWKVELGSAKQAVLALSAVNLPGDAQRRRNAEDELAMRELYEERDLLVAEVQSFFADGAVALQARSGRYRKLSHGQLVTVPPSLIKRLKQHFVHLDGLHIELIIGMNGYIWVGLSPEHNADAFKSDAVLEDARARVVRCAQAVRVLAQLCVAVTPAAVKGVVAAAESLGVTLADMTSATFQERLLEQVAELAAPNA
mmetsp:Transcript_21906/g.70781  ORF Transcript_21906/g.70781 Transcript_21906/m.70781 type:complete len:300 (-) Transcript_21906:59-958(-)